MSGRSLENGQKTCQNCGILFKSNKILKKYCSENCRDKAYEDKKKTEDIKRIEKLNRRFNGKLKGIDYIVCPVCSQKVKEISRLHAKKHGFDTPKDFAKVYNLETTKCQKGKDILKGENNPGYNHGGKLSSWSKHSKYHTLDQIECSKQKAKENRVGKTPNYLEYWIKKCDGDVDLAKKKYSKHQSNGLTKMIELYGEEEGTKRWVDRQERWLATLDAKSDEEKSEINRKKLSVGYFISKLEQELVFELKKEFSNIEEQFYIKDKKLKRGFSFDCKLDNKIIEFFGDFWHHNPLNYDETWINPVSKVTSKYRWAQDIIRVNIAEQNGYDILVVWERDYKKDKEKVINECINFLKQ